MNKASKGKKDKGDSCEAQQRNTNNSSGRSTSNSKGKSAISQIAAGPTPSNPSETTPHKCDNDQMVRCKITVDHGFECGSIIKYISRRKHVLKTHRIAGYDLHNYLNERMFPVYGDLNNLKKRDTKADDKKAKSDDKKAK